MDESVAFPPEGSGVDVHILRNFDSEKDVLVKRYSVFPFSPPRIKYSASSVIRTLIIRNPQISFNDIHVLLELY